MLCKSVKNVYHYYYDFASIFTDQDLCILKTDCHNESGIYDISIPLGPVLNVGNKLKSIEINQDTIDLAAKKFPNLHIAKGDITRLDLSEKFDLILDYSTIDHVQPSEYKKVLESYRALSNNISIIVWLAKTDQIEEAKDGDQMYFNNLEFTQAFKAIFKHYNKALIFKKNDKELIHFTSFDNELFTKKYLSLKIKKQKDFDDDYAALKKKYISQYGFSHVCKKHFKLFLKYPGLGLSFNPIKYLFLNPDVLDANMDPYDHFINHGFKESRGFKF